MSLITQLFKKEVFIIAWVIGVELFWLWFAISMFCWLMFLSLIDTMLWYYIAHQKKIVSSRIGADGLMKKVIWIFLLAWAIWFLGNMWYVTDSETLKGVLSWCVIIFIMFRVLFELISLIENLAIISSEQEKTTLKWIVSVLTRIVWIWQKQIDAKIDKYTAQ